MENKLSQQRVFIATSHDVFRRGLSEIIAEENGLVVAGTARSILSSLRQIIETESHVAIVDFLGELGGVKLLKEISVPIIACSVYRHWVMFNRAKEAMVDKYIESYFSEQQSSEMITTTIRQVATRKTDTRMVLDDPIRTLTKREVDVFKLMGLGASLEVSAAKFAITRGTIEYHRSHLCKKIGDLTENSNIDVYQLAYEYMMSYDLD